MSLSQWDVGNVITFAIRVYLPEQRERENHSALVFSSSPGSSQHVASHSSEGCDPIDEWMKRRSSSWWNDFVPHPSTGTCNVTDLESHRLVSLPQDNAEGPSTKLPTASKSSAMSTAVPRSHPHKHNILIAINDEPIDIIKARCNSTDCGHATSMPLSFTKLRGTESVLLRTKMQAISSKRECHACNNEEDASCSPTCQRWFTCYLRELILFLASFALVHTGFRAQQNVDFSLFSHAQIGWDVSIRMGAIMLFVMHLSMALCCLAIPKLSTLLAPKLSMFLGLAFYSLWICMHSVTNAPTKYPVLLLASLFAGLGHALSWTGQVMYLDGLFKHYYASGAISSKGLRYLHISCIHIFQILTLVGNLVVFIDPSDEWKPVTDETPTMDNDNIAFPLPLVQKTNLSGIVSNAFCEAALPCTPARENFQDYSCSIKSVLILTTFSLVGTLCCLFLKAYNVNDKTTVTKSDSGTSSSNQNATAVVKSSITKPTKLQIIQRYGGFFLQQKLALYILPVVFYHGVLQATLYGDFNMSYVACWFGIPSIGVAMIFMVLSSTCTTFITEMILIQHVPRIILLICCCLSHCCLLISILVWSPSENHYVIVLIYAALWGVADGAWSILVNGMISLSGLREGYSTLILFRAIHFFGMAFSYGLSIFLDIKVKAVVLLVCLCLASACFPLRRFHIHHSSVPATSHSIIHDQSNQTPAIMVTQHSENIQIVKDEENEITHL